MLTVAGKALGRKKPLFADWALPLPPELREEEGVTLRHVIERIVREEVTAFKNRQSDRQLVRALTAKQIEAGVEAGQVTMGGSDVPVQEVDAESAVGAAL